MKEKVRLRDSLTFLSENIHSFNCDSLVLHSKKCYGDEERWLQTMRDLALNEKELAQIKQVAPQVQVTTREKKLLEEFIKKLKQTGIFLLPKAYLALFERMDELNKANNLVHAAQYSLAHNKLWLCTEELSDDSLGKEFLCTLYQKCIQACSLDIVKTHERNKNLLAVIKQKYHAKINEFIAYRKEKQKHFNKSALQAFYDVLCVFERKKYNIVDIINQSIHRGYNWIFPLTHKNRYT